MTCKELTLNGLKYVDEQSGENKNIPRFQDDSGYKYSEKEKEIKDALFLNCRLRYADVDPYVLEILIDYYMHHPEKMAEEVNKEWDSGFDPTQLQTEQLNNEWTEFNKKTE
jgi:hypothetical protein